MSPDEPCSCPGPGFCERFKLEQQQYPWEVCQGKHGEEKGLAYRRKWSGHTKTNTERVPLGGVPLVARPRPQPQEATVPKGVTLRVWRMGCRKTCQWAWAVMLDGNVKEQGREETQELAQRAAEAEAAELKAFLAERGLAEKESL